jgi:hypothetical protein
MANIKFSDFTGGASIVQADHFLVGFDTDATAGGSNPKNNKWTFTQVAAGLAAVTATPYSIYAGDGTITTGRKALLAGTLQFRNAGDSSDIFTLNTNGNFTLGLNAGPVADSNCVTIGNNAQTNGASAIAIGGATWSKVSGLAIGQTSYAAPTNISIGQQAGDYNTSNAGIVTIGNKIRPTGANSITLAARNSSASNIVPNVDNTFNVYLADASTVGTEDFQIVRGGESTLRTSLKITGQAYTELHTGTTPVDPNWNNGNIQESTLVAGSRDFDPTNPKAGATYILKLTQPASADGIVNWDNIGASNIKWPGGVEPTLTASAGAVDIITLICTDGTGQGVYYASATLNMQ